MTDAQATALTGGVLGIGGLIGTIAGGWFSDRYHHRWKGGRIVIVVWSSVLCAVLFMISFAVDVRRAPHRPPVRRDHRRRRRRAGPAGRDDSTWCRPSRAASGASAMALTTSVFGTALAPRAGGWISDVTGSLVAAFYIVFPPVILGLLLLLRARHTLEDDAQAIVTAIYEENLMLEAERRELGLIREAEEAAAEASADQT